MGSELHAPARYVGGDPLRLLLRRQDQIGQPRDNVALRPAHTGSTIGSRSPINEAKRAGHALWDSGFGALRRRAGRPFVGSPASDRGHVVARFARQRAVAGKPRAYSSRTGIVGRRGESEIAKPVPQFAEITCRVTQRLSCFVRSGRAQTPSYCLRMPQYFSIFSP